MEGLLFLLLPILLLVVLCFVALGFLETAFARQRALSQAATTKPPLPLLSGEALRSWAAELSRQVVARYAQQPRTTDTAVAMAHEIEGLTTEIIDESLPHAPRGHSATCNQCSRQMIRLTAPEILAIVDDLRRRHSRRELLEIRSRAASNAKWIADERQLRGKLGLAVCPLLSLQGCCASYESRPLCCRGHCPNGADDCRPRDAGPHDAGAAFAATVGQGVTEGLTQGLDTAGWDGRLYELNDALTRVLDIPDAGARWARGEAVFG